WMGTVARYVGTQVGLSDFFRRLLPYLRPYPFQITEIMVYLLFGIAFSLGLQKSLQFILDNVSTNLQFVFQLLIGLGIAFVINALASLRRAYLTAWVSEKILIQLRLDLFTHLQDLSASFYSRARVGDIVSRMSNDLVVVQQALSQAALTGIYYALSFVLAALLLVQTEWRLALVVAVTLPLLFLSTAILSGKVTVASRTRSERLAEVTDVLQERLNAWAVVRAFGLAQRMIQQFTASLQGLFGASVNLVLLGSLFGLSSNLITSLMQILVLALGAYLIA